jgi:hypothetical protein
LGDRVLAATDDSGDIRNGFNIAMADIAVDEPVIFSVERGSETLDLTIVPEVREPLTWKSVVRFPSAVVAPSAPGAPVVIENIVVPQIDTEALTEQIERMRSEIEERRYVMEFKGSDSFENSYDFEFHEMSEMGDFALADANVWFGLPLARGLQLAEIDEGLGQYFKTDRGVLVLKAEADNDLQLESGDVILRVGDSDVNSPADFMRALRGFEPGEELEVDIKRDRKDRTLKSVMPERQAGVFVPEVSSSHHISITTESN